MKRKATTRATGETAGSTLLEFLAVRFTYLGTEDWLRHIAEGRIKVNGEIAFAEDILAAGDSIAFDPSAIEEPKVDALFDIVFEDEDYLVTDKSGFLLCHPGGRFFEHSLWHILKESYMAAVHGRFPCHLVARGLLKKDETGLVRKKRKYVEESVPCDGKERESCETDYREDPSDTGYIVFIGIPPRRRQALRPRRGSLY